MGNQHSKDEFMNHAYVVCNNIYNELATIETALVELLRNKEAEELKLNEADQAYYTLRTALQEKESTLRLQIKSKELMDQLINEIKDKLNNLKLQLAGTKERLSVEFKVELEEILDSHGMKNISELKGKSLEYFGTMAEMADRLEASKAKTKAHTENFEGDNIVEVSKTLSNEE